ncbi:hypothetical protein [Sporisorium scitamineum]|uniref:Uncharacterized protein n=1 Tax=Sporisorium scitamineum TaxID=49012 RepID=A0A0F7SAV4_9BASI|nr:hypothetical protein [Sporisorium scitamineum]
MNDHSLDPQLAPRPPHPGYFQPSFIENPWYDLERKHEIPHLEAISLTLQPQHGDVDVDETQVPTEQVTAAPPRPTEATTT